MKKTSKLPVFRSLRRFLGATALGLLATASSQAFAADPIKLGVIAEAQAIARQCPSLPHGISVEVRAIAAFSPVLPDLSGRPGVGEK